MFSPASDLVLPLFAECFFLSVFTRLNQPVWFHSKTSILEIMLSMLLFFADISFTAHLNTDIGGEFFLMFSKEGCQLF